MTGAGVMRVLSGDTQHRKSRTRWCNEECKDEGVFGGRGKYGRVAGGLEEGGRGGGGGGGGGGGDGSGDGG